MRSDIFDLRVQNFTYIWYILTEFQTYFDLRPKLVWSPWTFAVINECCNPGVFMPWFEMLIYTCTSIHVLNFIGLEKYILWVVYGWWHIIPSCKIVDSDWLRNIWKKSISHAESLNHALTRDRTWQRMILLDDGWYSHKIN